MRTTRTAGLLAGLFAAAGVGAAAGWAYTGTPAGKKLTGQVLASYKHVHAISGTLTGDVWYCPSIAGGVYVGARATTCPTPGTQALVNTLSNGRVAAQQGTVKAHGQPTISFEISHAGSFWKAAGDSCWKHAAPFGIGATPFGYASNESMSVTGSGGGNVVLTGVVPGVLKEVDTVSASTHEIVAENIHFLGANGYALHTRYHNVSAPKALTTTPLC
jgi:hypothetical protein